ncbi:MAG: hypothetical protein M3173_07540 [Chloroflexota bacterium]|nr:hypothetical protein [Chloroflexota bacterium]
MSRQVIVGLITAILIVVAVVASKMIRRSPADQEPEPVQWPFEHDELAQLMDRVVESQDQIIQEAPDPESRARARAFRDYYERRRAAV